MRNMAEPSTQMDADKTGRTWERNSTRQAILDAARQLAARDGADAITLSRVAAEAGFAPPAVYAYFVSKDDLHLAVVADDLEKLARAMRGDDGADAAPDEPEDDEAAAQEGSVAAEIIAFNPVAAEESEDVDEVVDQPEETAVDVTPQSEDADTSEEVASAASALDHDGAVDAEDDVSADLEAWLEENEAGEAVIEAEFSPQAAAEAVASSLVSLSEIEQAIGVVMGEGGDDYVEPLPPGEDVPDAFPEEALEEPADGVDALEETVQAETPSVPLTPGGAPTMEAAIAELQQTVARLEQRPVDSWLERRLRVFERTLADIERRMEKVERDSTAALSTVSESFKALEERFSDTQDGAARGVAESDERHRAATADLRLYMKDLAGRLGAVETSFSRLLGDPSTMRQVSAADMAAMNPPDDDTVTPAAAPEPEASSAPRALREATGEHYLSAARRAANSAAAEADHPHARGALGFLKLPDLDSDNGKAPGLSVSRRALKIIAGILTLLVVVIAASITLRGTVSADAIPAATVTKTIAVSPDERVVSLAKAGNANAELVVALKLMNGDGLASDIPSAAHWLKKAAAQKQPVAEYWLGTLYERGRGVDKDLAKAVSWYEAAAKAGNAKAMYRLGVADAEGWTGEPNYVAAGDWFEKAAHLGIIDAAFNLAILYERGQGVPQSLTHAFAWYSIAAGQGDAVSKARLDALVSQITPDQVAAAQAEAAKFKAAEPSVAANVDPSVRQVAAQH